MHTYVERSLLQPHTKSAVMIILISYSKQTSSIRIVLVLTKFRCWDVILKNIVGSHQIENSSTYFLTIFPLRGPGGGWGGDWILSKMLSAERWVGLAHRRADIQKRKAIHTYCLWAYGEQPVCTEKPVVFVEATVLISAQPQHCQMEKH